MDTTFKLISSVSFSSDVSSNLPTTPIPALFTRKSMLYFLQQSYSLTAFSGFERSAVIIFTLVFNRDLSSLSLS